MVAWAAVCITARPSTSVLTHSHSADRRNLSGSRLIWLILRPGSWCGLCGVVESEPPPSGTRFKVVYTVAVSTSLAVIVLFNTRFGGDLRHSHGVP